MTRFKRYLALLLILCVLPCAAARADVNAAWVKRAVALITHFESGGDYGLAHNDTNGLPSLGFIQWNGNRCMVLLNRIIDANEALAREILGDAFFGKVRGKAAWKGKMTSAELAASSKLLKTEAGIRVQDALAASDVAGYIEKGMALGIRDATALVYYADIRHQVGSGAIVKYQERAAKLAGGYANVTLEHLYQAALNYATHTAPRRKKAYQMLVQDPVGAAPEESAQPVKPTRVTLGGSGVTTLYMNETLTLTPALTPAGAVTTYAWLSSNRKIATVEDGVVTPRKPGKLTVRVRTANGLTASAKIRVRPVLAESVALSGETSMKRGEVQTLTVKVMPNGATNPKLKFQSSNRKIAAVSGKGAVKALKPGTATIYCRARDGGKAVGKITITVK